MKPLLEVLRGRPTPHRPVWLMRQAGRYLPEYRRLRERHGFHGLLRDPDLAARVSLQPLARFPLDGVIVFADLLSPAPALGFSVAFTPGPVVANPLAPASPPPPAERPPREALAPEVAAALQRLRAELPPHVALIGFTAAPWTLAAYLVEGRHRDGFPRLRAWAAADPAGLATWLRFLAEVLADYALTQVQAGAEVIQIFDTWAGVLSRGAWERLARPPLEELLRRLGASRVPRILFVPHAPHLLEAVLRLPAEGVSVDWRVDLAALRRAVPDRVLQGNLDPAVLLAGPAATTEATERLLRAVPPRGHIVNLGHGVLPETPPESVAAFVAAVKKEGGGHGP